MGTTEIKKRDVEKGENGGGLFSVFFLRGVKKVKYEQKGERDQETESSRIKSQ